MLNSAQPQQHIPGVPHGMWGSDQHHPLVPQLVAAAGAAASASAAVGRGKGGKGGKAANASATICAVPPLGGNKGQGGVSSTALQQTTPFLALVEVFKADRAQRAREIAATLDKAWTVVPLNDAFTQ
jgi:hypothetical protein